MYNWGHCTADPETIRGAVEEKHAPLEQEEFHGFVSASNDPLELDAFVTVLLGMDPHDVGYLSLAAETFGGWSEENIARGRESGIEIF